MTKIEKDDKRIVFHPRREKASNKLCNRYVQIVAEPTYQQGSNPIEPEAFVLLDFSLSASVFKRLKIALWIQ